MTVVLPYWAYLLVLLGAAFAGFCIGYGFAKGGDADALQER